MNRRAFIRLAGGGGVFAAATGLTACSGGMPAAAIEAWKGPGDEPDVRKWILSYAILAPNPHNLQSWLVDLRTPNEITLYCDLARLLPETDPFSRQTVVGQGTFLELLDIAGRERGLRADITLFPQGDWGPGELDRRPIAHVRLTPDGAVAKDPLFAQILRRRTNRERYDIGRAVPAPAIQAMADSAKGPRIRFGFAGLERPEAMRKHRAIATEAWRIENVTPRAILESYKVLRVGAAEIARHRDGISINKPLPSFLVRVGLFDRSKAPKPDAFAVTSQVKDFNEKLESTPGFLWLDTEGNDRKTQVNAGRAYVRVQLAGTAQGLSMQPLSQALQEYPEQALPYADIHNAVSAPRPRYTVQMWARVGFAPEIEPAPRRGLPAHILS